MEIILPCEYELVGDNRRRLLRLFGFDSKNRRGSGSHTTSRASEGERSLADWFVEGFSLRFEAFNKPITFVPTFILFDNIQG
jgi:hypothetical protein